jgi:hypothetical protein
LESAKILLSPADPERTRDGQKGARDCGACGRGKMKIISFESSEERIGFLFLVVFMACVVGFAVWHAYAYPPCAGLHGKELRDCEDYQVYLSEFSGEHDEHTNGD